ncbi:hypothetical protein JCM18237_09030 [Halorubrum luteum]
MDRSAGSPPFGAFARCVAVLTLGLALVAMTVGGAATVDAAAADVVADGTTAEPEVRTLPLADAGLDQTVTEGTTVHLDGSGSRAPDGVIERYEWEVADSDGKEIHRSSGDAPTTSFDVSSTGGYEATLVVIDDAGRSDADTLFIEVEPADARGGEDAIDPDAVDPDAVDPDATIVNAGYRRLVDVDVTHEIVERRTESVTVGSATKRDLAFRRGYRIADVLTEPVFAIERRTDPASGADGWTRIHETTEIRRAMLAKQHADLRVDYDTGTVDRRWRMERRVEIDRGYVDELEDSHEHVRTEVAVTAEMVAVVDDTGERVDLGVHGFSFAFEDHRSESVLRANARAAVDRSDCEVDDGAATCTVEAG